MHDATTLFYSAAEKLTPIYIYRGVSLRVIRYTCNRYLICGYKIQRSSKKMSMMQLPSSYKLVIILT